MYYPSLLGCHCQEMGTHKSNISRICIQLIFVTIFVPTLIEDPRVGITNCHLPQEVMVEECVCVCGR